MESCFVVDTILNIMKVSTRLTDQERHYLTNLLISGAGEIPDDEGRVSKEATHRFTVENGFIIGAEKVMRKTIDNNQK